MSYYTQEEDSCVCVFVGNRAITLVHTQTHAAADGRAGEGFVGTVAVDRRKHSRLFVFCIFTMVM